MLQAYWAIMKTAMKSIINNKSSVVIMLLQSLVPIIVMGYLWYSILSPGQTIGGLSRNQMITYYCGVNFINFLYGMQLIGTLIVIFIQVNYLIFYTVRFQFKLIIFAVCWVIDSLIYSYWHRYL